ncbi:MAG: O-antigen ligase family protein [Pseudomonadota bacterium]
MSADGGAPAELGRSDGAAGRARAVLVLVYAALPLIATFAHRGLAPLMAIAVFAAPGPREVCRRLTPARVDTPFGFIFIGLAGLAAWTALAALWSPAANETDEAWGVPLAFIVGLAALTGWQGAPSATNRDVSRAALAGVAASAVLLAVEGLSGGALRSVLSPQPRADLNLVSLGRGATILVLLLWPALVLARLRFGDWRASLALAGLTAVAVVTLGLQSNMAALLLGGAAFLGGLARPKLAVTLAFAGLGAALWASPLIALAIPSDVASGPLAEAPLTWLQRLVAWSTAGREIAAHPLFGGGLEAARHLAGERELTAFPGHGVAENVMPLHPHNVFLHLWMELGLVGAAAASLALAGLARLAVRSADAPFAGAAIAGAAAAFLAYAVTDWSMWQIWRIALLFLLIGTISVALHPKLSKMR